VAVPATTAVRAAVPSRLGQGAGPGVLPDDDCSCVPRVERLACGQRVLITEDPGDLAIEFVEHRRIIGFVDLDDDHIAFLGLAHEYEVENRDRPGVDEVSQGRDDLSLELAARKGDDCKLHRPGCFFSHTWLLSQARTVCRPLPTNLAPMTTKRTDMIAALFTASQ
jgi:hypothetical protein